MVERIEIDVELGVHAHHLPGLATSYRCQVALAAPGAPLKKTAGYIYHHASPGLRRTRRDYR